MRIDADDDCNTFNIFRVLPCRHSFLS
jgi:hypothetical protein